MASCTSRLLSDRAVLLKTSQPCLQWPSSRTTWEMLIGVACGLLLLALPQLFPTNFMCCCCCCCLWAWQSSHQQQDNSVSHGQDLFVTVDLSCMECTMCSKYNVWRLLLQLFLINSDVHHPIPPVQTPVLSSDLCHSNYPHNSSHALWPCLVHSSLIKLLLQGLRGVGGWELEVSMVESSSCAWDWSGGGWRWSTGVGRCMGVIKIVKTTTP